MTSIFCPNPEILIFGVLLSQIERRFLQSHNWLGLPHNEGTSSPLNRRGFGGQWSHCFRRLTHNPATCFDPTKQTQLTKSVNVVTLSTFPTSGDLKFQNGEEEAHQAKRQLKVVCLPHRGSTHPQLQPQLGQIGGRPPSP